MHTRRRFLALSAASAAALTTPDLLLAQPRDTIEGEVLRQFRIAVHNLHTMGKAEHARQVGSLLRIFAAHGRITGVDGRVRAGLRQMGRAGILTLDMDQETYAAQAKAFGIVDPPPLLYVPPDARERIYDQMLKEGITPFFDRAATFFENWQLDAVQVIAARRTCGELSEVVFWSEIIMAGACLFGGGPACGAAVGAWVGFSIAYRIKCV